jgi:hypothetical protein
MTDEELKRRAEVYAQLIEYPPFQCLVAEAEELVEDMKEAVVNDLVNDRLLDKGVITGIRNVINIPRQAVVEYQRLMGNSEPS